MNTDDFMDTPPHKAIYGQTATVMTAATCDDAYIAINDSGYVVSMCCEDGEPLADWMEKHTGLTLLITSREYANHILGKPLSQSYSDIFVM